MLELGYKWLKYGITVEIGLNLHSRILSVCVYTAQCKIEK